MNHWIWGIFPFSHYSVLCGTFSKSPKTQSLKSPKTLKSLGLSFPQTLLDHIGLCLLPLFNFFLWACAWVFIYKGPVLLFFFEHSRMILKHQSFLTWRKLVTSPGDQGQQTEFAKCSQWNSVVKNIKGRSNTNMFFIKRQHLGCYKLWIMS